MRLISIMLTLPAILVLSTPTWADERAVPLRGLGGANGDQRQMLAKFDLNGDGQLDDAEKAKAAAQMQKQLSALDKNGNGRLDPEEVAFARSLRSRAGQGGGPQYGASGGGGGGFGGFGGAGGGFGGPGEALAPKKTRKQRLQEKLDRNGDGKITKEERAAAAAERKAEQEALKAEKKAELEEKKARLKAEAAADEK